MKDVKVGFPIIDDVAMKVASLYGMIQPGESQTAAVRAVFFVDPKGVLRAMIYYPLALGRNFDHRRLRHRAARRLASGRRGDRADEGRRSGEGSRRGEVLRLVFLHQTAAERGDRTETRREGLTPLHCTTEEASRGKPLLSCAFVSLQSGDGRQRPLRSIPGSGIAVRRATRGAVRAPRAVFCPLFAVLRARSIRRRTPRG